MIYTVTLNPSIDYVVRLDTLETGSVNRSENQDKYPGGKGINVSRILKRLDVDSTALGFLGGFTGRFIEEALAGEKITTRFTPVKTDTRINVKLKADQETEINGQGPDLTEQDISALKHELSSLTSDDLVVLAGSIPGALPSDFYQELIALITKQGAEFIIDTTGDALLESLEYHPLLIKPNHHELGEMFDTTLVTIEDIIPYGQNLLKRGAKNVIVSMGKDGALLITPDLTIFAPPIKGDLKNSVGAGDSMVAGFISQLNRANAQSELEDAFRYGVASGSATAFSGDLATKDKIVNLLPQVTLKILN
ncbi:1-phosphofructokinase [Vagococcus fessus]|uniref:Tagatose-6-phosphate kinase n=1 Tax=Vagococcus fessus TaxID=120370 RepID=A0A430AD64_9ENTE|nr:1-phosphofructokinase [Vagococcus fessus]RSU05174.1 1-phosphofructokinase [Vagococcus fessus]